MRVVSPLLALAPFASAAPGTSATTAAIGLATLAGTLPSAPAHAENEAALDLYIFSQQDGGGQPYRAEGMVYGGLRLSLRYAFDPEFQLTLSAAGSLIENDPVAPLPSTIDQALTTQASSAIITLDAQILASWRPHASPLTLSFGPYYHHQRRFVSLGGDLRGELSLADGDTILGLGYSLRVAITKPRRWDDVIMEYDNLVSHSAVFAWTQTLSPSWILTLGGQATVQRGDMTDNFNYVVLYDPVTDLPTELGFERMPRQRDRGQLDARVRFSPLVGLALGLDTSIYLDTWKVLHGALEPSVEIPLTHDIRLRLWYRFSAQTRARYVVHHATAPDADPDPTTAGIELATDMTQDADLDAFAMHSPGFLLRFPIGGESLRWIGRLTGFAFFRSDGVSALGANLGLSAEW